MHEANAGIDRSNAARALAVSQGAFYAATGLWPFASERTFERVTGPKTDRWLVKTVGALVTAIGFGVAMSGVRRRVTPEMKLLAAGAAAGLAAVETFYVARRRIATFYLLDAVGEIALAGAWGLLGRIP